MPKYIEITDRDINKLFDAIFSLRDYNGDKSYFGALKARMEQAIEHEDITPKELSGLEYLNQGVMWKSKDKGWMRITEMHPSHAANAADWLSTNSVTFCKLNNISVSFNTFPEVLGRVVGSSLYKALNARSRDIE